jgi:hypothetical protein
MIRNPVRNGGEAGFAAALLSTVLARNPEFFTNCSLDRAKRREQSFDFAEHNVLSGNKAQGKVASDQLFRSMPIAISST